MGHEIPVVHGLQLVERLFHGIAHDLGLEMAVNRGDVDRGVAEDFLNDPLGRSFTGKPRPARVTEGVEFEAVSIL